MSKDVSEVENRMLPSVLLTCGLVKILNKC